MPFLAAANQSRLLAVLSSMLFNMGARFLTGKLTPLQESLLATLAARRLVAFSMFFTATRDLVFSLGMTLAFCVLLEGLLNEGSRFCVLPGAAGLRGVLGGPLQRPRGYPPPRTGSRGSLPGQRGPRGETPETRTWTTPPKSRPEQRPPQAAVPLYSPTPCSSRGQCFVAMGI
jgi:hypothetical protein